MAKKGLLSRNSILCLCCCAVFLPPATVWADDTSFLRKLDPAERLAKLTKALKNDSDFTPATLGPMTLKVPRAGTVESAHTSALCCEIDARTDDSWFATNIVWIVDDETMVKKGDTLAVLDCSYVYVLLEQQKAVVARAEEAFRLAGLNDNLVREGRLQTLRQAQIDLDAAELELRKAPGAATLQATAAQRMNALDQARLWARLHDDHTAVLQRRSQLRLEQARARLRHLENQIARCVIRAPQDGLVTYPYQPVKGKAKGRWNAPKVRHAPGEKVSEGQLLLRVSDLTKLNLSIGVSEDQVAYVRRGQKVHVSCEQEAFPKRSVPAVVISVSEYPSKTGFRGDGRVYTTRLELQGDLTGLRPEMKATASITVEDCLRVPARSLVTIGDNVCCFVLGDNGLEERIVETGLIDGDFVAIEDGLEEGELVIKNPRDLILRLEAKK